MHYLKLFPLTQVHMDTTRQTRVKATNRSHDIDTLEVVRPILFEDGCVLHSVLVGTRCAIDVSYTSIPGGRRIGMVVGDLPVLDDHVMGEYTTYRFMEPTADGFLWYGEFAPCLGVTSTYLV